MHRKNEGGGRKIAGEAGDRAAHADHSLTETFAAMHGDEDETAGADAGRERGEFGALMAGWMGDCPEQGVDAGVAREQDVGGGDAFPAERSHATRGGRGVRGGETRDKLAVDFLGKRERGVVGAQAGLDVDDRGALIKTGEGAGEGRGGVALDSDPIGVGLTDERGECGNRRPEKIGRGLSGAHELEGLVGQEAEFGEGLRAHVAVLAAETKSDPPVGAAEGGEAEGGLLDDFGPRAGDHEELEGGGHGGGAGGRGGSTCMRR